MKAPLSCHGASRYVRRHLVAFPRYAKELIPVPTFSQRHFASGCGLRLVLTFVILTQLLVSGIVLAAPDLISATNDLQGALIPGGEIVFTAEGTPGCVAKLVLTIRASGSSTPLTWETRMQEESDGLYIYRWTVWESTEISLDSAVVQLSDRSGGQSTQLPAVAGPVQIGGEIRGKVTDALTQTPLPNVQVMAYSVSTRHFALGRTNHRGEYTLAGLGTAKDYRLWTVNDQGYTEAKKERLSVSAGGSTTGVDLVLSGLSAISGSVEDESGSPLSGITVTAERPDGGVTRTTTTDDQGQFSLTALLTGSYDLSASSGAMKAATSIEVVAGKIAATSFRLSSPRPLSSCEIVVPEATGSDQVMYWPRRGGPVRMAPLSASGAATLSDLTSGEELVIALFSSGLPSTHYPLRPMDQGPYTLERSTELDTSDPALVPLLTLSPPLTTRGGSALLSGRATGMGWVDLWLDDQWEARLPVTAGRWQTNVSLDQGEHQVTVMAVGSTAALKAERRISVSRTAPAVLQMKVNQQAHPSLFSCDGGGQITAVPKQPLTASLTTTQAGTTNWLILGERQWVMGRQGDIVTTTIPTDAMAEGEHLLTWRWERQGVRGELPLGTLIVRKPIVRTVIDAITGEPIPGVRAALEQLTDDGWQDISASPFTSNEQGQVSLWMTGQGTYRLRLTKPGYTAKVISIDPAAPAQETVIPLMPTRPAGPISISPGRDARAVDPSATITVAFARDLAPKSVNANTFHIQGTNAKVSYDPLTRKATLEPVGRLGDDSYYLVHLSGSICYADGTSLGRDLWWLISTADATTEEGRSTVSSLTPVGHAATLTPRDGGAKATIPAGSSPVQTLYRLTRPSTLPKALPSGWRAVAAPLIFTATNSPLDKPIHLIQQGTEISIFYTDPPADDQATTLWRYDPTILAWVEHPYEHDPYLRAVRFTTDRPGTFVFAKQQQ